MPYFTRQVAQDGSLRFIAFIGVSQARRQALISSGRVAPNDMQVQAIVDTAASCTCVDPAVLTQLGLTPTGTTAINTPTTGGQPAMVNQYDVSLTIPSNVSQPALFHHTIPVVETALLAAQGFHVLLGRDVLRGCLLTYDGQSGLFTLAF